MKKLLTFIFILCTVALFAEMRGGAQYDPGAARADLGNVDATATPSMTAITLSGKVKAAWADILGDIYASGTVKVAAGTAAAPAYSFGSDPDTGAYSVVGNTIGFALGGTNFVQFRNGRVDIGTKQLASATLELGIDADANYVELQAARSDVGYDRPLALQRQGGNVLIGTLTDAGGDYQLQIAKDAIMRSLVASGTSYLWADSNSTYGVNILGGNNLNPTKVFLAGKAGFSNGFTIDFTGSAMQYQFATGNVLIGTSTDDGANKLQVNGPVKFQTSTGTQIFGQITLDDDESIDINTLLTGVAANCGIFKVLLQSNDGYGDFYLQGPANDVTLISQRYAAKTDSDGNICVFSAGSGNYTLKNRLGTSATFVFSYIGRK